MIHISCISKISTCNHYLVSPLGIDVELHKENHSSISPATAMKNGLEPLVVRIDHKPN